MGTTWDHFKGILLRRLPGEEEGNTKYRVDHQNLVTKLILSNHWKGGITKVVRCTFFLGKSSKEELLGRKKSHQRKS